MGLASVNRRLGADAIIEGLRAEGGVIVEDLFAPSLVERLWDELRETISSKQPGATVPGEENELFWGRNSIRFAGLAQLSDAFVEIMLTPLIHEVAEALMEGVCNDYWMNTAQFIGIGPGEPAQALHRDNDLWQRVVELTWPRTPELSFNSIIPLHRVTEEVGATRIVPGSNCWSDPFRVAAPTAKFHSNSRAHCVSRLRVRGASAEAFPRIHFSFTIH